MYYPVISSIMKLMTLKKYEPEILEPTTNIVYRGIKFNFKKLSLKLTPNDFVWDSKSLFYISKKKFPYTPNRLIQSWSPILNTLYDVLKDIHTHKDETKDSFYIIFKSTLPEKELLFNHKFMNLLDGSIENEVLHVGKKNIKVNILLAKPDYNVAFNIFD